MILAPAAAIYNVMPLSAESLSGGAGARKKLIRDKTA